MFPTIRTIDDVLPHIKHKPEIKVKEAEGLLIVCYMVAAPDTFDSMIARECRGITFCAKSGRVLARPLHKFFNVGEREDTQPHNLPLSRVVHVMNKVDGSLIHTVASPSLDPMGWRLKSKKSVDAPQVKAATTWAAARLNYCEFIEAAHARNLTAIFEWVAPDNQIVVPYAEPELRLLHLRNMTTGEYVHPLSVADGFGIALAGIWGHTPPFDELLAYAETTKNEEGVVLQFDNGEMVKLKTAWYLALHHAFTALRERDVARLALDEKIDDLYSTLSREGVDTAPIRAIHDRVASRLASVEAEVETLYESVRVLDRKTVATTHNGHPLFGLLMKRYSGKEPDYKKFVAAEVDEYPLTSVPLGSSINAEVAE